MWQQPPDPTRDPDPSPPERLPHLYDEQGQRDLPAGPPGAVTAVSVLLCIGGAVELIVAALYLYAASSASSGWLVVVALIYVGLAVVSFVGASRIRHGSRGWRTAIVVLCVLSVVFGVIEAFSNPGSLLGVIVNGLCIYLLTGARESRAFFDAH